MEKGTISIEFVKEALVGLQRHGLDPSGILRESDIPPGLLASAQARVSAASFSRLWLAVASALDDEFFGMDSHRMKVGSFATLSQYAMGARELRGALARAARFFDLVLDDVRVLIVSHGDRVRILLQPTTGAPLRVFAYETLLILLHGLSCWLVRRRIPVTHASFVYPRPERWREYSIMYSPKLQFEADWTGLEFDSAQLEAPVVQTERSVKEFLRRAPYNIILKYRDSSSWSGRARHLLRRVPPERWPRFEALAARLGIHPASFRRRLEEEGTSFRALKDDLRRDMAIERLSHSELRMAEIAQVLGFAEPSAFHRAFKQWTGLRPGEYRQRQGFE